MAGESREFGPYHLVRRLGVGGMAETFEATRAGTGGFEQRVCLKRVLPAFSQDDVFVAQFRREATLAAQLRHSNIVGVIDFGEVDRVHYMALELVDGVDLRSFLRSLPEKRLSPELIALLGLDLAYALEHAHESIVHRDISPANILISRAGEAKLADFGIAKTMSGAAATASQTLKGKIPYMSPEQMRGEAIDGRADLFSLGVVLFEAAAGIRPFDGAHDVETMQKILDGDRRSIREAQPDLPEALCQVIDHLIEIDRDKRTPSASVLIEELSELAPSPQVRRELASNVEAQRGGPQTRMHVRAREEERDTELSRAPDLPLALPADDAPPLKPESRREKKRVPLLVGSLLILLAVGVVASEWLGVGEAPVKDEPSVALTEQSSEDPEPAEASTARAPQQPVEDQQSVVTEPDKGDSSRSEARSNRGWLNVVVQPWGNVWIDDVWMGRAPVKARVSKGRHVVKAGRELPTQTRVVEVEAGAQKEIEISLPD